MVGGGQSQKWTFRYGNAETFEDRILCANFSLSPKVTISIVGDTLNILDFRYNGKFDEWSYCNKPTAVFMEHLWPLTSTNWNLSG